MSKDDEGPLTEAQLDGLRIALRIRVLEDVVASLARLLREAEPESFARWEEKLDLWWARSRTVTLSEVTTERSMLYASEYEDAVSALREKIREHLK